jgi:hypothetical protein
MRDIEGITQERPVLKHRAIIGLSLRDAVRPSEAEA